MTRPPRSIVSLAMALAVALSSAFLGFSNTAIAQVELPDVPQADTVARPGGTLPGNPSIQLVRVADGLADPVNVAAAPDGSGRIFVVERIGRIQIIQDGEVLAEPFLDISNVVKTDFLEQGLLGLAFHPQYAENGRFFVYYTDYQTNGDSTLVEFSVSGEDANLADPDSARVLFTYDQPFINHNGGTLRFGPDGYLYLSLGDGGLAGDPYRNAQNINNPLGSILRLDVDIATGAGGEQAQAEGSGNGAASREQQMYGTPSDNPFQGQVLYSPQASPRAQNGGYTPAASPEIWAYGLRNPWQFSFDRETGDMYIADVGQNAWEEINVLRADSEGGVNFGWPFVEGAHCYLSAGDECNSFGELPVAEYNHGDGSCSITGVGVYRGTESTSLNGIYFTSDFCSGKVWGLAQGDGEQWNLAELLDTDLLVTGSGEDEAGEIYLTACNCQYGRNYDPLENPGGSVWRIVASDQVPEGAETTASATQTEGADTGGADAGASTAVTATNELTSTEGLTGTESMTDTGASGTGGSGATGAITGTNDITATEETTGTGGTTGTGETAGTGAAGGSEAAEGEERVIEVIARSMDYVPGTEEPIQIQVGETIRFVVTTPDIYHTFTVATDESKQNILFNLDVFPGTEPSEIVWTFDEAGSYYLYCIPHENLGMVGSIEVTE